MPKMINHDRYVDMVFAKTKTIEVLGNYQSMKIPLLHRCKVCHFEWHPEPRQITSMNQKCPNCSLLIKSKNLSIGKEKYEDIISDSGCVLVGEYVNCHTNTKHRCRKCDNEWDPTPSQIMHQKQGCKKCSDRKTAE